MLKVAQMMGVSDTTRAAMTMLLQADVAADPVERAGWLALLGHGPAAVPREEASALLRLVSRSGAVLSPAEAAARMGVSRQTLYRWERLGAITFRRIRVGLRRVGLPASDVEREAAKISELKRVERRNMGNKHAVKSN
jgi:excisionase family DNA binding protein